MDYSLNYVSVVVDELDRNRSLYARLGLTEVQRGRHSFFEAEYALYATGCGGILIIERGASGHPAIKEFANRHDRHFHMCIACDDLERQYQLAKASPFVRQVTDPFVGVGSDAIVAEIMTGPATTMFIEFSSGLDRIVHSNSASVLYVESVALHVPDHSSLLDPLASLGLYKDEGASGATFPQLGASSTNAAVFLNKCWLEINALKGTGSGLGAKIMERLGRPGISGISLAVADIQSFQKLAAGAGIPLNSTEPFRLDALHRGKLVPCADILTVNRKATENVSLFMMEPLDYPHTFWSSTGQEHVNAGA